MKAKILVAVFIFSGLVSCNSQTAKSGKNKDEKMSKPHEEVTVNRKYDENGNLIEFDSTYTSYYSNVTGDTIAMDSVLSQFPEYFNNSFDFDFPEYFFDTDSAWNPEFFHRDFFESQFMEKNEEMRRMIQQMDSIKNEFFRMHSSNGRFDL